VGFAARGTAAKPIDFFYPTITLHPLDRLDRVKPERKKEHAKKEVERPE
jgi:hypothetical protein